MLLRPDELRGLAGAWPLVEGRPLLAAWNAWPAVVALNAPVRDAAETAALFVAERWPAWVA